MRHFKNKNFLSRRASRECSPGPRCGSRRAWVGASHPEGKPSRPTSTVLVQENRSSCATKPMFLSQRLCLKTFGMIKATNFVSKAVLPAATASEATVEGMRDRRRHSWQQANNDSMISADNSRTRAPTNTPSAARYQSDVSHIHNKKPSCR